MGGIWAFYALLDITTDHLVEHYPDTQKHAQNSSDYAARALKKPLSEMWKHMNTHT